MKHIHARIHGCPLRKALFGFWQQISYSSERHVLIRLATKFLASSSPFPATLDCRVNNWQDRRGFNNDLPWLTIKHIRFLDKTDTTTQIGGERARTLFGKKCGKLASARRQHRETSRNWQKMHSKNREAFKLRTEPDDILVGLGGGKEGLEGAD